MVTDGHEPCSHAMHRRSFLGLGGAALATAGLGTLLGVAPAGAATTRPDGKVRFGLVSDTHLNVNNPSITARMTQVFASMARRDPDFVLHCGDITDTGLDDEFVLYGQTIPDALHGKIHYSPGNHETRWDHTAKELYHSHFGPAPYSFDAGGVHFIGFDPTQVLQDPGHSGASGLAWLEADLRAMAPGTPAVLFQHFPVGRVYYFLDDKPQLLEVLAGHNVRAILAGHIHAEDISRFNGLTQVTFNAVKNGALYYWIKEEAAAGGTRQLQVSRVVIAPDSSETTTAIATIPLAGPGQGREQRPVSVQVGSVAHGRLPLTVQVGTHARPLSVSVQPYPQEVFGAAGAGTVPGVWQDLTTSGGASGGRRWTGAMDVSAMAPGQQRLQVRVLAQDGAWWEDVALYNAPSRTGDPKELWRHQLPGSVQGGITPLNPADGTIVAASSTGAVTALRLTRGGTAAPLWRAQVAPAYRRPAVDKDARTVYVPGADHRLYALDAATGRTVWQFDAGAPVLSAPSVTTLGDKQLVVFSAGEALFALDGKGRKVWSVAGRGFSAGQAACDGQRVYTVAADGYARAHDAATGKELWAYRMTPSGDEFQLALNSGWDDIVALGADLAIVANINGSWALDAATGAPQWTLKGSAMYAPTVVLKDATALFTTEYGVVSRVDLATGKTIWQTPLNVRVFEAGLIVHDDTAWIQSVDGKLIGLRINDGTRQGWLQHTLAFTFSSPAIVNDTLVVGDQNGVVHGIALR
ncbi:PQQ-binding-like beta-propeller repeat protein [Streptomyces sp. NPDC056291]|uniref:outer membrane protein assembly factor BamB family protein n=1 Tax=Streptomyces sp. NPDC056291 TaxID=3345772 RepID=UPI0035D9306F